MLSMNYCSGYIVSNTWAYARLYYLLKQSWKSLWYSMTKYTVIVFINYENNSFDPNQNSVFIKESGTHCHTLCDVSSGNGKNCSHLHIWGYWYFSRLSWFQPCISHDVLCIYYYLISCRWQHPYGKKWRGTKEPVDESERGEWKSWLKAQHSEN